MTTVIAHIYRYDTLTALVQYYTDSREYEITIYKNRKKITTRFYYTLEGVLALISGYISENGNSISVEGNGYTLEAKEIDRDTIFSIIDKLLRSTD